VTHRPRLSFPRLSWVNLSLVIILLLSAFLRLYRLDEIPPGLTHDEADTGYFFAAVARGARSPVKAPYGYAYEALPMYTGALFIRIFGFNPLALRLHSAFFGMATLILTYLWARRAFGPAVGLGGAALMGFSFWTVADSRFALNSQPATTLFTVAVYALGVAIEDEDERPRRSPWARWLCWGLFSLSLAGSLHVYEAARGAAGIFVLFLAYLALFDRDRFRRHGPWLAGALLLTGTLAAPHLLDPGSWGRTSTLSGPIRAVFRGDPNPLLANVVSGLGTFSFSGDSLVTYNLPGRPIFDPLVSLFFYAGVCICLSGLFRPPDARRRSACALTLMWLLGGIAPTLILGAYTSTLHSKLAEPPVMVLPALGALGVGQWIDARLGPRWRNGFAAACVLWLGVVAGTTGYDYFVRWGESAETRAAYFHNLAAIANYVNADADSVITLSSPFPDLPLDPFIADMTIHRDSAALRWCDARRALVFPDAEQGRFILPPNTPLDPYFARRINLQLVRRVHLRPTDVDPYFDVFAWRPREQLAAFVQPTPGELLAGGARQRLPVNFGDVLELLSVHRPISDAAEAAASTRTTLVTTWRVLDPAVLGPPPPHDYDHEVAIFVHALDDAGAPIGQEDRLDAPAWNWRAGDAFVQIHRLPLAPGDLHHLAMGLYRRHDLSRLPVLVDGEGATSARTLADHLILVYPEQAP